MEGGGAKVEKSKVASVGGRRVCGEAKADFFTTVFFQVGLNQWFWGCGRPAKPSYDCRSYAHAEAGACRWFVFGGKVAILPASANGEAADKLV